MQQDKEIRDWEKEFDDKFGTIKHRGFPQQAIKSFITALLHSRDLELVAEIKKFIKDKAYYTEEAETNDDIDEMIIDVQDLQDWLNLLTKRTEK